MVVIQNIIASIWTGSDSNVRVLYETPKTWGEANAFALSQGANLAKITSAQMNAEIYYYLVNSPLGTNPTGAIDGGGVAYIWLGATNIANGSWKWSLDGSSFSYVNWGRQEPDNFTSVPAGSPSGQHYAAMGMLNWPSGSAYNVGYGNAGQWNDLAGTDQLYFLVEKNPNTMYSGIFTGVKGVNDAIALLGVSSLSFTAGIDSLAKSNDNSVVFIKNTTGTMVLNSIEALAFNDKVLYTDDFLTSNVVLPLFISANSNTGYSMPVAYSGPVTSLQYQLFDNSDGAVITAPIGTNDFIYLSSTNTAANKATNGNGGQDVIAGGVGSSFIAGGTNHNSTFFLDGRASGISWSTITDFNIGTDNLTIFGWNPSNSSLNTTNPIINGAVGFTGLTLYMNNLAPDGSAAKYVNPALNQITLANHTLAEFGYNSIAALNTALQTLSTEALNNSGPDIIASHTASNGHFTVGQTTDNVGTGIHWYLNVH